MNELEFENSRRDLLLAFYNWAVEDALGEFRSDFDTFRKIPSRNVWRFLEYADKLSREQRELFLRELLVRAHARKLPELKQTMVAKQQSLLDQYFQPLTLLISQRERTMINDLELGKYMLAEQRILKNAAKDAITDLLGQRPERWSRGTFRWTKVIGKYMFCTDLDAGSTTRQLTYFHSIYHETSRCRLIENTSLLSWCGISGMTTWDYVQDGSAEECVTLFRSMVKRFLSFTSLLES